MSLISLQCLFGISHGRAEAATGRMAGYKKSSAPSVPRKSHIDEAGVNRLHRSGSGRASHHRHRSTAGHDDRRYVMIRKPIIVLATTALIAGLTPTVASAAWYGHRSDIRADRRDIRADRFDLRHDRGDLRRAQRELARDLRFGGRAGIRADLP